MKAKSPHRAGLAAITLALPASADVIYSNFQNIAIPATYDGVYLNVENGAWNTDMFNPVAGWDINPYFGGQVLFNSPSFQPVRSGTGNMAAVLNLSEGSTVGGSSVFSTFVQGPSGENPGGPGYGGSETHLGNAAGQFTDGGEGYIGFRLNGTNYGSMRVVLTNNTGGAVIKDWAYDTSGAPVVVGAIKQVGQDVIISSAFTLGSAVINSGGSTNLVKNSSGTNSLTATSAFTGTTTISVGTLAVDGSGSINTSSGVTVSGGTFRYNSSVALAAPVTFASGTIGGTNLNGSLSGLEIGAGQTLSPGATAGPGAAATTSQIWAGGGIYQFEINDAAGNAGSATGWDLVSASGSLSVSAASGSPFIIDVTTLGFNGDAANFDDMTSYNWLIADFGSTITDFAANAFSIDTNDFSNTFSGNFGVARGEGIFGGDDSQIYLTYTAVPEPRAALLAALGVIALLRRRRD